MTQPNVKALLLQMKLDENPEMRVLAEETIINYFDKLTKENQELNKKLKEAEANLFTINIKGPL